MHQAPAIEISGLGKAYEIGAGPARRLWNTIYRNGSGGAHWALRDFDLTVARGETVGVVGLNGSGKSTLLAMICKATHPTTGSLSVNGRTVAMLELGAGFNPDFTGRENAMLTSLAYGLKVSELKERLHQIEAFADIGYYFNRPVREYSSGMFARLAFAVCANADADIMLVDEVLSVGDALFQKKCRRYLDDFKKTGTVLFVSHDTNHVRSVCDRAVLLDEGRKIADGPVDEILDLYTGSANAGSPAGRAGAEDELKTAAGQKPQENQVNASVDLFWGTRNQVQIGDFNLASLRHGHGGCEITNCYFSTDGSSPARELRGGQQVTLHIEALAERDVSQPIFGFIFRNERGHNLFGDNTFEKYRNRPIGLKAGQKATAKLSFQFPYLPAGIFGLSPSLLEGTQQDHIQLDWLEDALTIAVKNSDVRGGEIGLQHFGIRPICEPWASAG